MSLFTLVVSLTPARAGRGGSALRVVGHTRLFQGENSGVGHPRLRVRSRLLPPFWVLILVGLQLGEMSRRDRFPRLQVAAVSRFAEGKATLSSK
ncbi:hypothetical protein DFH07DRAFT_786894 [Mycena maculata]|uniref:Uncharacterized protein n=1 Tax=Mycena maculata TaxID=230809 RepID=A0AAD7P2Q1_9AGAR|nr:hypothetical protein DFH07DRAFT_786894 [Mycena maculata]